MIVDPSQVDQFAEEDQRSRLEAVKALSEHRDGRHLLWWLLHISNSAGPVDPFAGSPELTAHNCGRIAVGKQLADLLEQANPTIYPTILKEAATIRHERAAHYDSLAEKGPFND